MPAISSANGHTILLSGHNPDQDAALSGSLLSQGTVSALAMSNGLMQIDLAYWVRQSRTGHLDFFFQIYNTPSIIIPGSMGYPTQFAVQWMYGPTVAITYADSCYNSLGGVAPSSFQWGPNSTQFAFNFTPGIVGPVLSRMFYIRTNATSFIAHGSKITSDLNSSAAEGYGGGWVNNLVLPAPNSATFIHI